MSVRSAVNAVLTELVRSLSRALAAVLWRTSPWGDEPGGPSLSVKFVTLTPAPPHIFLFLFTLMWKADWDDEDRRKDAEWEELLVRSSEPEPSLQFSSSSSERRPMSPYKKRPAGGGVRSMAKVIFDGYLISPVQELFLARLCSLVWLGSKNVLMVPMRVDWLRSAKQTWFITSFTQSKTSAGWAWGQGQ